MAAKKKATKKAAKAAPKDPRDPIAITPASMKATLVEVEKSLAKITPPEEPQPGSLADAMLHYIFSRGLPCGYGQEVLRRIETDFVDRNEYRVTEAYEIEEAFADLGFPDTFERCLAAKEAVSQLYNDQNAVSLEFLREAPVAERKGFFARVPAITPDLQKFLAQIVGYEEVLFSPRSTQRVQQRLGFDPKGSGVEAFFGGLRELIAPYGHLPLRVGPDTGDGKPILEPELSALCVVVRLGAK